MVKLKALICLVTLGLLATASYTQAKIHAPVVGVKRGDEALMELSKHSPYNNYTVEMLQADPTQALQLLLQAMLSTIPVIGGPVSILAALFFPNSGGINIWELIKDQVQEAIDAAILEAKLGTLTNDLTHIRDTLDDYSVRIEGWDFEQFPVNDAAGTQLDIAVNDCNRLMLELNGDDRELFVALAVPTAIAHLTALYERFHFGLYLYNGPVQEFWRTELEEHIIKYTRQLTETMDEWEGWRRSRLRTCTRTKLTDTKCCTNWCASICPKEYTTWGSVVDEVIPAPSTRDDCEEKSVTQKIVWQGRRSAPGFITSLFEAREEKAKYGNQVAVEFRRQMAAMHTLNRFGPDYVSVQHFLTVEGCPNPQSDPPVFVLPSCAPTADNSSTAAIRCCDEGGAACDSYCRITPQPPTVEFNHMEAEFICSAQGKRLCSRDELYTGVCCGTGNTGCNADDRSTWTSTECKPSRMVVDGCSSSGTVLNEECRPIDSVAAVRCCTHSGNDCDSYCPPDHPDYPGGPKFPGAPDIPASFLPFEEAKAWCASMGQRLCTSSEIDSCCNSGCDGNSHLIWTSDKC